MSWRSGCGRASSLSRFPGWLSSLTRALFLTSLLPTSFAFYLPGSAPRSFAEGDSVPLLVNTLSPQIGSKKQLQSLISYDFYNPNFHFCRPGNGKSEPKKVSESLGSVLFGDRLYESAFDVKKFSLHKVIRNE